MCAHAKEARSRAYGQVSKGTGKKKGAAAAKASTSIADDDADADGGGGRGKKGDKVPPASHRRQVARVG